MIPGVFQPWGGGQNGNHGIGPHSGADQTVKVPGKGRYAVGQAEGHPVCHGIFFSVAAGAVQGAGVHIGSNDGPGDAAEKQINPQIAVVAAYIRHPVTGTDKLTAGFQPVGKDRNHVLTSCKNKVKKGNAIPGFPGMAQTMKNYWAFFSASAAS